MTEVQAPTVGRIVHYRLTQEDCDRIEAQRGAVGTAPGAGSPRYFFGNPVEAGQVVPLIVVRAWPSHDGLGEHPVNGQAFLDGNDTLWITSAPHGEGDGSWRWPPRV